MDGKHTVTLDELRSWSSEQYVPFASASAPNGRKRLDVRIVSGWRVTHGVEVVYEGQDASDAVRAYNEI